MLNPPTSWLTGGFLHAQATPWRNPHPIAPWARPSSRNWGSPRTTTGKKTTRAESRRENWTGWRQISSTCRQTLRHVSERSPRKPLPPHLLPAVSNPPASTARLWTGSVLWFMLACQIVFAVLPKKRPTDRRTCHVRPQEQQAPRNQQHPRATTNAFTTPTRAARTIQPAPQQVLFGIPAPPPVHPALAPFARGPPNTLFARGRRRGGGWGRGRGGFYPSAVMPPPVLPMPARSASWPTIPGSAILPCLPNSALALDVHTSLRI